MKMIVLMMLFSTPGEPEPHSDPAWGPRTAETMSDCLERRSRLQAYFESNLDRRIQFKVFCVEFNAVGYDEAVDAFQRHIGDPS